MNIALETIDVWTIKGEFSAACLFRALPKICKQADILVVGSYDVSPEIQHWLTAHNLQIRRTGSRDIFSTECFDVNRQEYPRGGAFALNPLESHLQVLAGFSLMKCGGGERDLFIDHLLAYRPGIPLLPLFDFHDAFRGGDLRLSGLFCPDVVKEFTELIRADFSREINPVLL